MPNEAARTNNLLGAFATALNDAVAGAFAAAGDHGATASAALVTVAAYPGEPVEALARILALTPAGATRLIDRLQAAGLVERQAGRSDGRSRAIVPTARGRAEAERVIQARRAAIERALAPLTDADCAELTRLLERMLSALTPDRATCDHTCRLCDLSACPQDRCPIEQAALRVATAP